MTWLVAKRNNHGTLLKDRVERCVWVTLCLRSCLFKCILLIDSGMVYEKVKSTRCFFCCRFFIYSPQDFWIVFIYIKPLCYCVILPTFPASCLLCHIYTCLSSFFPLARFKSASLGQNVYSASDDFLTTLLSGLLHIL